MDKQCCCKKIPTLSHELNQSLVILHSYTKGCNERIKKNDSDLKQLALTFEKINVQIMTCKIHHMNKYL